MLTAVLLTGWIHLRFGLDNPPSATGDEPSYVSIGWELSQGRGFAEDFNDQEFRRPWDPAAATQPEQMTLPDARGGTVTYRPPLFPLVLAAGDLVFGRQFVVARLWNVMAMSVTCGLLVTFTLHHHAVTRPGNTADTESPAGRSLRGGVLIPATVSFVLFVVIDVRVRLYARAVLTEATAVLLTAGLAILLCATIRRPRRRISLALGATAGLTVLNRTAAALWLPTIAIGLWVLLWREQRSDRSTQTGGLRSAPRTDAAQRPVSATVVWVATALAILAPWAIRNMVLLQAPMPLGAQGLMELPAGFSDRAWERGGLWFNLDHEGLAAEAVPDESRLERERRRAVRGRSAAVTWIRNHPVRSVVLGGRKIWNEYRPRSLSEALLSALAVIGVFVTRRRRFCHVFLLLHLANCLAIAVTWSVEGRFVVPLLFTIHVWAAAACLSLLAATGLLRSPGPDDAMLSDRLDSRPAATL